MNSVNSKESSTSAVPTVEKRVILSMGGKGGVGKTSVMTGLAEWFQENGIPVKLLDLDTENKARGSLTHFFGGQVPKVNIHTPAGLDAFVDELTDGPPVILADMGAGAGQVTYEWFDKMYADVTEAGIEFTAVGVVTADRLLLSANRREAGLRITNGEVVTVKALNSAGQIQLDDGRTLPSNYRSFAHGYAVTAHRSQGKTVDSVIISGDGMQKELFYVAASRGRQSVTVITSEKERLQQTVARSMARRSASELLRGNGAVSHRGVHRGLAMARAMVRRAAQFVQQVFIASRKERSREHSLSR